VVLAQNYNTAGRTWATGDFTGDGNTDFNDLVLLAQKYNTSYPAAGAPVVAAGGVSFAEAWAAAQGGATVAPTAQVTKAPSKPAPVATLKPAVVTKPAPVVAPAKAAGGAKAVVGKAAATGVAATGTATAAAVKSPFSTSRVSRGNRDLFA
jgi:hypothetical protein